MDEGRLFVFSLLDRPWQVLHKGRWMTPKGAWPRSRVLLLKQWDRYPRSTERISCLICLLHCFILSLFTLKNVKRNKNDKLIIHYSTFKINQTVKLVKLFEKMFNVSSIVLDNSLKTIFIHQCCCWWKSESSLHSINRTCFCWS